MDKDQDVRSGGGGGDIKIRAATTDDVGAVRKCIHAAFTPYTELIGQEPAPMKADFDAVVANDRVLVAEVPEARVAGVATARLTEPTLLEIDILAVLPDWQGAGLARALMQSCEARAKQDGAETVVLYTNEVMGRALGFYRRLGYEETDRIVEDGYRRVYLRKAL